ncbi:MAG: NAD(P)/FAD-dependent oxidoreductase [Clostridia bacterium]
MYDLVIIGAGVWGAAAGLAAVEAGSREVLLLEARDSAGGGMSAKSGGIVSQLLANPDDQQWVARSRQLFEDALARSGDTTMIERAGGLALCSYAEGRTMDRIAGDLRGRGIPLELLDRRQIMERFPLLDGLDADTYGMWSPTDWHVNPTAYADATVAYARSLGLQLRIGCTVTGVMLEDDKVILDTSSGRVEAARVLVAAGVWTRKITKLAGIEIPLRPYRVQLASLSFPEGRGLPILSETTSDVYITPDGPANILAGDGTQLWEHDPDAYNESGDASFEQEIAAALTRLISAAQTARLRRSWAGLCGGTPDRRPLIGPVSERLYIACGGNGFGVKRGPAIGELAAQMALETAPRLPQVDPFRFPSVDFELRPGSGGRLPD